jgi:hypothetical protein
VEKIEDDDRRSTTLLNSGFIREKEMDSWRATTGDPYGGAHVELDTTGAGGY